MVGPYDVSPHQEPPMIEREARAWVEARVMEAMGATVAFKPDAELQPIETAPKDGSQFLAFQSGRYFNCWWHDNNGFDEQYWMDEGDTEPNPTHWMPLPPAPDNAAAKRKLKNENKIRNS
jgi:Protein of unknown function (DUF551)